MRKSPPKRLPDARLGNDDTETQCYRSRLVGDETARISARRSGAPEASARSTAVPRDHATGQVMSCAAHLPPAVPADQTSPRASTDLGRGALCAIVRGVKPAIDVFTLAGVELTVFTFPIASESMLEPLTDAEREVVVLVLSGHSSKSIAEARNTSARTVANQLASVFKKLHVSGRGELAAALGIPLE
jgi:DNA-binding CsgD family transcriptional regulator